MLHMLQSLFLSPFPLSPSFVLPSAVVFSQYSYIESMSYIHPSSSTSSPSSQLTSASLSSNLSLPALPASLSPPPSALFQSSSPAVSSESFSSLLNSALGPHPQAAFGVASTRQNSPFGAASTHQNPPVAFPAAPASYPPAPAMAIPSSKRSLLPLLIQQASRVGDIRDPFATQLLDVIDSHLRDVEKVERERDLFLHEREVYFQKSERLEAKVDEMGVQMQTLLAQRTPQDLVPFMNLRGGNSASGSDVCRDSISPHDSASRSGSCPATLPNASVPPSSVISAPNPSPSTSYIHPEMLPLEVTTGPEFDEKCYVQDAALNTLTFQMLKEHRLAPFERHRVPPRNFRRSCMWTADEAKKYLGTTEINRSRLNHGVLRPLDGIQFSGNALGTHTTHINRIADIISNVMLCHIRNLQKKDKALGIKYFEEHEPLAYEGAIAILEAMFPLLRLCGDHFKAHYFLMLSLRRVKNNHANAAKEVATTRVADTADAAKSTNPVKSANAKSSTAKSTKGKGQRKGRKTTSPQVVKSVSGSSGSSSQTVSGKAQSQAQARSAGSDESSIDEQQSPSHTPPRSSRRADPPRTPTPSPDSSPNSIPATIRAKGKQPMVVPSPLKVQPKRASNEVFSPRHDAIKRSRAIARGPIPVSFEADEVDAGMQVDPFPTSSSTREIALTRGLGSTPPVVPPAAAACLPSGRKIVDINGLSFPDNSFNSLKEWLDAHQNSDLIDSAAALKMRLLLDAMLPFPGFQRTNSKPAALEFKDILHHCDPNDVQYDDDDNNDLQLGHAQFSGHWQDATASWDVIGSTTMARDFLVGAIKIVTMAHFVSHKRGIPQQQLKNLLAKLYLSQLVDAIAKAWEEAGGNKLASPSNVDTNEEAAPSTSKRPRKKASAPADTTHQPTPVSNSTSDETVTVDPCISELSDVDKDALFEQHVSKLAVCDLLVFISQAKKSANKKDLVALARAQYAENKGIFLTKSSAAMIQRDERLGRKK
ncbi:hypothetical protein EYR40_010201 [Pleurotus pulmonarius]|nr:hypothetical protein EYR38_002256 [Pleurotus pulmonarius]KAF4588648.1 hypothetical protein EYR40_010201 [Pleurotus pulmonarius]